LNRETVRVLNKPDIKDKFLASGVEAVGTTPQELGALIKSEIARMGKVIKDVGIRTE
jgi:tripartite-type tricarboxylate transporter receptor subunit TctC